MILIIDCSTENAFVCLADNGKLVATKQSDDQKKHAAFLHIAIKALVNESAVELKSLSAIAVVSGPGSYTGVRVAMASAKGLCIALQKPLILLNGLELLAFSCFKEVNKENSVYIPLIDARRMEVFTAVYNSKMENISPPVNYILEEESFYDLLNSGLVHFNGNGIVKAKSLINHSNAIFCDKYNITAAAAHLAQAALDSGNTADIIYSEPLYIKPFFQG